MTGQVDTKTSLPDTPAFPASQTNVVLGLLLLTYTCNFMDRTIIGTLAQAIKVDLKISDAQLGLLQGFAFVVLYAVMGLPMARLAERKNRVTLLSICVTAWSLLTMLCGMAQNFWQLLLCRIGVGIGEAGCNPVSHSIIAGYFPERRRGAALAVYTFGVPLGTMIGAMSGGVLAEKFDWRVAFVIVGAPGLLIALAIRLFLKEPPRTPAPAGGEDHVGQVLQRMLRSRALLHLLLGFTLTSFTQAGINAFTQPYFIREFGLTYGQIGLVFGFFAGLAGGLSVLISGRLGDFAAARDLRWYSWLPGIGVAVSAPLWLLAFTVGDWRIGVVFVALAYLFMNWFITPTLSAMHRIIGAGSVATGMALILFFQNIVGLGGGPYLAGLAIDAISQHLFTAQGLGEFNALCPGGQAAAGAPASLAAACHDSLANATRLGLMATVAVSAWAILHFILAARHVRRELSA